MWRTASLMSPKRWRTSERARRSPGRGRPPQRPGCQPELDGALVGSAPSLEVADGHAALTHADRYGPLAMVNVHVEVYVPANADAGIASEKLRVTLADPSPVFAAAL